jgi:hypothetical protein
MSNKIKFTICEPVFDSERKVMKFPKVGDFDLSLMEMRDTIVDSIDLAFEQMKNNIADKPTSTGIIFMPYIKVIYDQQDENLVDDDIS